MGEATKTDEFSEKIQMAFDPCKRVQNQQNMFPKINPFRYLYPSLRDVKNAQRLPFKSCIEYAVNYM